MSLVLPPPDKPHWCLQDVRVLDPYQGLDRIAHVYLSHGVLQAIQDPSEAPPKLDATESDWQRIAAQGLWWMPSLVDASMRLRQVGQSGHLARELRAALAGGVADVLLMPDTVPVLDEPGLVQPLLQAAQDLGLARLHVAGALTLGLAGQVLSPIGALSQAGCCMFTQADAGLPASPVLERALQYAASFGASVCLQPSKPSLSAGGVAAASALATQMGLQGIPAEAETLALHAFIGLVRRTGVRLHVSRISSAASLPLLRAAKAEGLPITADVDVFHVHLDESAMIGFDGCARLHPPLRSAQDRLALCAGLADGTIDVLVSDHAVLSMDAKIQPFASSAPGGSSVEWLASLWYGWFVHAQAQAASSGSTAFTPLAALNCVTRNAAALLGPEAQVRTQRGFVPGEPCQACLFDPHQTVASPLVARYSAGAFTPFNALGVGETGATSMHAQGQVLATWVDGRLVHRIGDA